MAEIPRIKTPVKWQADDDVVAPGAIWQASGVNRALHPNTIAAYINTTEAGLVEFCFYLTLRSDGYAKSDIEMVKKLGLWREPK